MIFKNHLDGVGKRLGIGWNQPSLNKYIFNEKVQKTDLELIQIQFKR